MYEHLLICQNKIKQKNAEKSNGFKRFLIFFFIKQKTNFLVNKCYENMNV